MKKFGFEEANHLDWSNDYLDFVITLKLLLRVYEDNDEANIFQNKRQDLRNECLKAVENVKDLSELFQYSFPLVLYGITRAQT